MTDSRIDGRIPRYDGPELTLSEDEIIRLGGCVFLPSGDTGGTGGFADADFSVVNEVAERLTDAHVEAALRASGLHGGPEAQRFAQLAAKEGGAAAFVRARLGAPSGFSAGGCALGVAEIVVGVAAVAVAGAEEVGSVGLLTPGAVLTAVAGGAFIGAGIATVAQQC